MPGDHHQRPGRSQRLHRQQVAVDKRGESVDVVTPAEVAQLKQLVRDWVAQRKDDFAGIDNDEDADPQAGRGADGGGGHGGGDAGGGGAGVEGGDGGAGNGGGGAGGENFGGDGGGGGEGGAGTSGGAHPGMNVRGDRRGGDDAPSGTDAAIDDLFWVSRTRHQLSPTTSEERPVMRRRLRPKWSCSRVDSDAESTGRSSAYNSDLDFIVTDGASPESRQSCVCVSMFAFFFSVLLVRLDFTLMFVCCAFCVERTGLLLFVSVLIVYTLCAQMGAGRRRTNSGREDVLRAETGPREGKGTVSGLCGSSGGWLVACGGRVAAGGGRVAAGGRVGRGGHVDLRRRAVGRSGQVVGWRGAPLGWRWAGGFPTAGRSSFGGRRTTCWRRAGRCSAGEGGRLALGGQLAADGRLGGEG